MKAFILAAGKGTRLMPLTAETPKALIYLKDGLTPLDFQIDQLIRSGIATQEIFVIVGYRFEKFEKYKESGINIVINEKYDSYNNIYSFLLVSNFIKSEEFLVLNVDTIFDFSLLAALLKTRSSAMVVDNFKIVGEEETKVKINKGRIVEISKSISPEEANGEYIGISKFSPDVADVIFDKIREMLKNGEGDKWYEDALNRVLNRVEILPVYTDGKKWIEIDTIDDLKKAREMINDLQGD